MRTTYVLAVVLLFCLVVVSCAAQPQQPRYTVTDIIHDADNLIAITLVVDQQTGDFKYLLFINRTSGSGERVAKVIASGNLNQP
jgi:hypothetical protein